MTPKRPLPNWAAPPPPKPEPWRKPPCLVCDHPDPPFGVDCDLLRGQAGTWFCAECVPPDFFPAKARA